MYLNNKKVLCDYYYHSDQSHDEEREYKENLESTRITLSLLAVSDVACVQECNDEVNTPCPYDVITTTNIPAQAPSPPRILTPATTNVQNNNITTQKPYQTNSKFAQFMAKKKTPYVAEVPSYAHLPPSPTNPTVDTRAHTQESDLALTLPHREEEEEDKENIGHNYDPPSSPSPKASPIRYSYSRPPRLSSSSSTADDTSLVHVTDMNTINEALLSLRLSLTPRRRRSSSHEPTPMHSPIPVHLPYTPLIAPSTTTPSVKTRSASQIPRWTPTPGTPSLTPANTATPLSQLQGAQLNSSTSKSNTKATGIPKRIIPSHTPSTPLPVPCTTVAASMVSATRSGLRYNTASKSSVKGVKRTGLSNNTPLSNSVVAKDTVTKTIEKSVKRAISRPQPRTTGKTTPAAAAMVKKGQIYDSPSGVVAALKRRVA